MDIINDRSSPSTAVPGNEACLPVTGQVIELPITARTISLPRSIRADDCATAHTNKAAMVSSFKAGKNKPASIRNKSSLKSSDRQIGERNSLESINSKCSISSGCGTNDDLPRQHSKKRSSALESKADNSSERNITANQMVEVRSRYVSPPKLTPDKSWPERGQHDSNSGRGNQLIAMMSAAGAGNKGPDDDINNNNNNNSNNNKSIKDRRPSMVSVQLVPSVSDSGAANETKPPFPFAGIAASLLGSVMFSFSTLFIKLLPDSDGFEEKAKALFFRGVFMSIISSTIILKQGSNFLVPRDEVWVNAARAVFGTLAVFGSYCALKYISIGDATAIVFSSPIWTSILSHFILKEPLQWIQLLALPISLFGIVLIAHPSLIVGVDNISRSSHTQIDPNISQLINGTIFSQEQSLNLPTVDTNNGLDLEQRGLGILIALLTSFLVSGTYIVLKFRKKTPIQTTTFWLSVFVTVSTLLFMSVFGFGDIPASWSEWALLIGNGVLSWLGQTLLQWAFLHESASVLSIMRSMDVAVTFTLGALFLEEDIYWTSILGSAIISFVVISIVLNNWIINLTCPTNCNKDPQTQEEHVIVPTKTMPNEHLNNKLVLESQNSNEAIPYIISTSKI